MHKTGDDVKFGASEQHEGEQPALSFASFVDLTSEAGFSFDHYVKHLKDAEKAVSARRWFPTISTANVRAPNIDAYYAKTLKTCTAAFEEVQQKGRLRNSSDSSRSEGLGLGHGSSHSLEVGVSDTTEVEMQNI